MPSSDPGFLWSLPAEAQKALIEISLSHHGKLIGVSSSPNSSLYTLDAGPNHFPRYLIAKALSPGDPAVDYRSKLERVIVELNNVYKVCHHPSLQRFAYVELIGGVLFVVSRKRDMTLFDAFQRGPLDLTQTLCIAIQIAHALNYCAAKGILCHQDLKAENIFLDAIAPRFGPYPIDYRTVVGDLELANAYYTLGKPSGSRPYMAPEQHGAANSNELLADFSRLDVFALGVLLVEMLSGGMHPVGEKRSKLWPDPAEEFRKWRHEDSWKKWARGGAEVRCQLPPEAQPARALITRCLKTNLLERPTMTSLESELMQLLDGHNDVVAKTLRLVLQQFDNEASVNTAGGWPYMDSVMAKVNQFFANSRQ